MKYMLFVLLSLVVCEAHASEFDVALNDVRTKCSGISEQLTEIKKMAGINTAITGVGTGLGVGATVVGIKKASVDEDIYKILSGIDNAYAESYTNPSKEEVFSAYDEYIANNRNIKNTDTINKLEDESKILGKWRTGLLGGSTATNVAGAIIANKNKVDEDLQVQIDNCIKSVEVLKNAMGQARMDGVDISQAKKIADECGNWKNADLSVVNNRAKGAKISSIVGAATGGIGTITSAVANTDKVRSGDIDTAKNLNTASNVLAGGTAVASGVATVFNATQIAAVKKIINIADNCEEVLK